MPPISTPYDNKAQRLRDRLKSGGPNVDRSRVRRRLQNTQARQYLHREKAAPPVMPWNTTYEARMGDLNRSRDEAVQQIANQQSRAERDFGFTDPSNPYSRAATLEKAYETDQRRSLNEFAGQGQLYSGAFQNRMDTDLADFGEAQYGLQQDYLDTIGDFGQALTGVQSDYDQGVIDAEAARLEAALEQRPTDVPELPDFVKQFKRRQRRRKKGKRGR